MKKHLLFLFSLLLTGVSFGQVVFESNFSSWTAGVPDGWMGSKTNIVADSVTQVNSGMQYGTALAELQNSTTTHKRFTTQPLAVTNGTAYEFIFWAKGEGDIRTGLFDSSAISTTFGYQYNSYINVNSTSWNQYSQIITADTTYPVAQFILSVRNTGGPNHLQIDSVHIREYTIPVKTIYQIQYTTAAYGTSPDSGNVVTTGGIVTGFHSSGYFIQSGTGAWNGIYVFDSNNNPARGDSVSLSATVAENFGQTQLTSVTNYVVHSSSNPLPAVTLLSTNAVKSEMYEGVLVRVQNATCNNAAAGFGEWILNDGSGDVKANDLIFAYTPVQGNVYNVTGLVSYSFGEFKIEPRNNADIENITGVEDVDMEQVAVYFDGTNWVINGTINGFEVIDLTGRVVLSEREISTNNYFNLDQSGIFFVRTYTGSSTNTIKIMN